MVEGHRTARHAANTSYKVNTMSISIEIEFLRHELETELQAVDKVLAFVATSQKQLLDIMY